MPLKEVVGGIYSLQPLPSRWLVLLAMGTPDSPVAHQIGIVHCPVLATSARSLGFGGVDHWNPCPIVAPDSLVPHRTCPVCSDFSALSSAAHCSPLFTFGRRSLALGSRCSVGSPDSPVRYSGACPRETREWLVGVLLGLHTLKSFAPNKFESPT
jgi:hypothetical protein